MSRVAYLLGTWPSPSETFLAREMDAVRAAGVEVVPLAFRPGPDGADPAVRYRPARLPFPRPGRALLPVLGHLPGQPRLALRWLRNLPFARWLVDACHDNHCDLLHAAWSGLPAQVAWMCRQFGGPPYSLAAHAHDAFCWEATAAAWSEAEGMVVCNRAAEAAVRARVELGERLTYLPHGLPLADWPRRSIEPSGRPLVLGIGRLVAKKGFDTLVLAANSLDADVEVIGDGPERARLERLAAGRVKLLGRLPSVEVRAKLAAAAVLALPSRVDRGGDRDGLANVLLEAMATGVPPVTTPAGSATDAVIDGETGLLVPPDDPAALAQAIAGLLADGALRDRLATAGRAVVEARYDSARNGARMARWLRAMAGDKEDVDVG